MCFVLKETSINLRVTQEFRDELQTLADYRGLSLSSLAHSILVKGLRREKEIEPEAFASERSVHKNVEPARGLKTAKVRGEVMTDEIQTRNAGSKTPAGRKGKAKSAK